MTHAEVIDHLNAIAPDTFDGGELGPWKFRELVAGQDARLRLNYENSRGSGSVVLPVSPDATADEIVEAVIAWSAREDDLALGVQSLSGDLAKLRDASPAAQADGLRSLCIDIREDGKPIPPGLDTLLLELSKTDHPDLFGEVMSALANLFADRFLEVAVRRVQGGLDDRALLHLGRAILESGDPDHPLPSEEIRGHATPEHVDALEASARRAPRGQGRINVLLAAAGLREDPVAALRALAESGDDPRLREQAQGSLEALE